MTATPFPELGDDLFSDADPRLLRKFVAYHHANPNVYARFSVAARLSRRTGRLRYSPWAIINVLRWDDLATDGQPFKIPNDFIACYARLYLVHNPNAAKFFRLRPMKHHRTTLPNAGVAS